MWTCEDNLQMRNCSADGGISECDFTTTFNGAYQLSGVLTWLYNKKSIQLGSANSAIPLTKFSIPAKLYGERSIMFMMTYQK